MNATELEIMGWPIIELGEISDDEGHKCTCCPKMNHKPKRSKKRLRKQKASPRMKAILYPDGRNPEEADFDAKTKEEEAIDREKARIEIVRREREISTNRIIRQFQVTYQFVHRDAPPLCVE